MFEFTNRKQNRLNGYDYSQNGKYFITICAKDRREVFSIINVGAASCRPINTKIGDIVENEIIVLSHLYVGTIVEYYVIMPNHIHIILSINRYNDGRQDAAPTVSNMVNQWKRAISIKIGYSIWQKSFYDHVIRNEKEYLEIIEYIANNPMKWMDDRYYPK